MSINKTAREKQTRGKNKQLATNIIIVQLIVHLGVARY